MLRYRSALGAAVVAVVAVGAVGAWTAVATEGRAWAAAGGDGPRVAMRGYAFDPAVLTVPAGTTVTWTNFDTAPHTVTVTSGPERFSSPQLSQGQSWSATFTVPGTYGYYCAVHPTMTASVVVDRAAVPTPSPAAAPSPGAGPAAASGHTAVSTGAGGSSLPVPTTSAASAPVEAAGPHHAAVTAVAAGPTGTADPPSRSSSRGLLVLAGVVLVVVVGGTLMVGGRTG